MDHNNTCICVANSGGTIKVLLFRLDVETGKPSNEPKSVGILRCHEQ
jgi:hypothetical protein